MVEFYVVYYFWKNYDLLLPENLKLNILTSVAHHWKNKRFVFPSNWNKNRFDKTFLDSGGFQLMNKFGDYPFSIKEYIDYVNEIKPTFFASMDYPCDGADHPSPHIKYTNKERIQKTVENARMLADLDVESAFVPVIQGYKLREYAMCIDLLKSYGLIKDFMAVGSVCIRKRKEDVVKILKLCKEKTNARLHVFGLNLGFLKYPEIRAYVDSFDTMAWMFSSTKFGRVTIFTGKRLIELDTRTKLSDAEKQAVTLRAFLEYFEYLKSKWKAQKTLLSYITLKNKS